MRAARIKEFGHAVEINEIPKPEPKPGQVLVEVHASSLNPFDTSMREGRAKPPLPATLGGDLAGVVAEVTEGVSGLKPGDHVYGSAYVFSGASGAFAQFAATGAGQLGLMPKNLSFDEAAAAVLTGLSAIQVIEDKMKLARGQKILIHGAAGGIGTMAVQLAKHLGAHVAATASGAGLDYAKKLGADEVIDYKAGPFEDQLHGYDAVFDTVAGDTYLRSYRVLRRGGIVVSMLAQPNVELMAKYGVTALAQQTRTTTQGLGRLSELLASGALKVHVDRTFPLTQAREAFEARESGSVLGKVVLEIN